MEGPSRQTLETLLGDMEDYVASWIHHPPEVRVSVTDDTTYLDIVKRDPAPVLNKNRFSIDEKTDDASSVSSKTNSRSSSQSSGTNETEKNDEKKTQTVPSAWKFGKKPSIERKSTKQLLRTQSMTGELTRLKKPSDPVRSSATIPGNIKIPF